MTRAHWLSLAPHSLSVVGGFVAAGFTPVTVILGLVFLASALAWTYTEFERQQIEKKVIE